MNHELFGKENVTVNFQDIPLLARSVNVTRLKNNPVKLSNQNLISLYTNILEEFATGDITVLN